MNTSIPFSKNDPPMITVEKIVHHKSLPGDFPTPKALDGFIRSSSPLMRDALLHMDTDPAVLEIAASPNRFSYSSSPYLYSKARQFEHIPALRIKNEHGRYVFIDVIPRSIQYGMTYLGKRTTRLREMLAEDYGAGYAVVDERSLHIQPRHRNMKIMWKVGRNTDDEGMHAVLGFVQQADMPMTIGEMRQHVHLPAPRFQVFDEDGNAVFGYDLDDVDRLFAAVMRLAIEGHLVVDTSTQLSDATSVNWRETSMERTS